MFKSESRSWPLTLNPTGLSAAAYAQAVVMDLRSVIATGIPWLPQQKFVKVFLPGDVGTSWADTYRRTCYLMYIGLGLIKQWEPMGYCGFEEDWDGAFTLSDATYELWEISKPTRSDDMARGKSARGETAPTLDERIEAEVVKGESMVEKGKETPAKAPEKPAKGGKAAKGGKDAGELTERHMGLLAGCFHQAGDIATTVEELAPRDKRLTAIAKRLEEVRQAIFDITG